jgi:hypothetical protein
LVAPARKTTLQRVVLNWRGADWESRELIGERRETAGIGAGSESLRPTFLESAKVLDPSVAEGEFIKPTGRLPEIRSVFAILRHGWSVPD